MKYIFALMFGFFVFALIFCFCSKTEDYEKLANKITTRTANRLENEKRLILIGTGGQMMDDIQMMYMGFQFFHPIDIKSGRDLLICAVNQYLKAINNDEKTRPYLHQYPFTADNIKIDIWIRNPNGTRVTLEKICYISASNGILTYYLDDPEKYSRKTLHQETYEEALNAVKTQVASLSQ